MLFILLVFYIFSHFATVESSDKNELFGNTDLLRRFYTKIAKTVKEEGERLITNELYKDYTTVKENNARDHLITMILDLDWRYDYGSIPLCNYLRMFNKARDALSLYSKFIPGKSSILDATYKQVETQCPTTGIPVFTDPKTKIIRSAEVVLMLTNEFGLGEFMKRSAVAPQSDCCSFGQKGEKESYRLQLHLEDPYRHVEVKSGGRVRLWANGHYLSKDQGKLKWNKKSFNNEQEGYWIVQSTCDPYNWGQILSYCDLMSFTSRSSDSGNSWQYLGKLHAVPNMTDAIFAIFGTGQVPNYVS